MSRRHETRRGPSHPLPKKGTSVVVETRTLGENPTTLTLFRFSPEEATKVIAQRDLALAFRDGFATVQRLNDRLRDTVERRITRINEAKDSQGKILKDVRSSITLGLIYLHLLPQLEEQGASPGEAVDFLATVLDINSIVPGNYRLLVQRQINSADMANLFQNIATKAKSQDLFATAVQKVVRSDPPSWFKGDKKAWLRFVSWRSVFTKFITFDTPYLGFTSLDALPDWFTKRDTVTPTRDMITRECAQDEAEEKILEATVKLSQTQALTLQATTEQTSGRLVAETERAVRTLLATPRSLTELVIALGALQPISRLDVQKRTSELEKASLQERERMIREFSVLQEANPSPEIVALFLESILIEGEIMHDAKEPTTENHFGFFNFLFNAMDESMPQGEQFFQLLRDTHPQAYTVLNNEVRPLLALLGDGDRSKLREDMEAWRGEEFEVLIWEMARLITEAYEKTNLKQASEPTKKVLGNIRAFTADWLSQNAALAHEALESALTQELQDGSIIDEATQPENLIRPQIESIEQAVQETAGGNLFGWRVYIGKEAAANKKSLRQMGGETFQDREDALAQYCQVNGIATDPRTILDLLDWVVVLPKDIEETARAKTGGEKFIPLKLGNARLLYQANPLKKELVVIVN